MAAAAVSSVVEFAGIGALWLAILLRAPQALRQRRTRAFWLIGAGLATTMTLHTDASCTWLRESALSPQAVHVLRNSIAVTSSCLVLHGFSAFLRVRGARTPLLWAGGAVVVSLLVRSDLSAVGFAGLPVPVAVLDSYWSGFLLLHVVAHAVACGLCVRAGVRGGPGGARFGLLAYGAGFCLSVLVLCPLAAFAAWTGESSPLSVAPLVSGVQAGCFAVGVSAPLWAEVRGTSAKRRVLRRLLPLWAEITAGVPEVRRVPLAAAGREVFRSRAAVELACYRLVIEIRDAVLLLSGHCSAELVERARAHVVSAGVPPDRVAAAVLACWLRAAEDVRARGAVAAGSAVALPGGADLESEIRFLLVVAEEYGAGPALDFRRAECSQPAGR
ncbi:MAB_1171c family putative transporter [Saccharopolyspora gregorii]|uniref:DUF6545 domain-containing protein n=1 Tax=Saccharopolyspora gregorii TaxID=33914 RepID=A0ABP6RH65_9PSEU